MLENKIDDIRVWLVGGMEKWEDMKDFDSLIFIGLGVEKWRDGKNEFE